MFRFLLRSECWEIWILGAVLVRPAVDEYIRRRLYNQNPLVSAVSWVAVVVWPLLLWVAFLEWRTRCVIAELPEMFVRAQRNLMSHMHASVILQKV